MGIASERYSVPDDLLNCTVREKYHELLQIEENLAKKTENARNNGKFEQQNNPRKI